MLRRTSRVALFVAGLLGIAGFLTACAGLAAGGLDAFGFTATAAGSLCPYVAGLVWGPRSEPPPDPAPAASLAPAIPLFR